MGAWRYQTGFGGAVIQTGPVIRYIDDFQRSVKDLRPVFEKGATLMRQSFARNFAQGGRPDAWKPLSPNTVMQKAMAGVQAGFPYATARGRQRIRRLQQNGRRSLTNILIAGGQLRDSYAQKNNQHISRVRLDGFEEGSKHWLAPIHEYGTDPYQIRPKRPNGRLRFFTVGGMVLARGVNHPGLPARPAAIYQDEDVDAIMKMLSEALDG